MHVISYSVLRGREMSGGGRCCMGSSMCKFAAMLTLYVCLLCAYSIPTVHSVYIDFGFRLQKTFLRLDNPAWRCPTWQCPTFLHSAWPISRIRLEGYMWACKGTQGKVWRTVHVTILGQLIELEKISSMKVCSSTDLLYFVN